ncbi:anthranilate phosphoribosyltransferase [[Pasteurella] aerogenes]|nr:anthranilate phosphoribosyltransferase [[Pasteurella] aerogenes]MCI7718338.1 anthranilate phosphoribosyltransferase [[Pasteurella] aerogenes]MCU9999088.1 anthranilate phosphoribosyltransferase [[Pasteurella] aerogenes]MDY2797438.1 anthranilate phosphoribosyltransferase [[Pasteurella] aerogenes]MDY4478423.1 anthranilate phosphoribosyltransferase [[Pasteurella] aerogenes]
MQTEHIINRIFDKEQLTNAESAVLFGDIIQGKLSNEQLSGVLIALKMRGETPEEISGAVSALLDAAQPFPTPDYAFADIVGTGGDGANTINISTASAFVGAACGVKVAKHGNRSVSSKTGASDLLTTLGINITMDPAQARKALDEINFCFLFAPHYHPGFKHAVPVRQALKTRTIFNILGPLINPAHAQRQSLGVYSLPLLKTYAETIAQLNHEHTIVVHGSGLDEVAIHGSTEVAEIRGKNIEYYRVTPQDFGFKEQPLESLRGGEPAENAKILTALLQGKGKDAHNQAVAMNTAMLLKLFGHDNLKENSERALDVLRSGKAFDLLQKFTQY